MKRVVLSCLVLTVLLLGCAGNPEATGPGTEPALRLGYMANLTHAQAVLGVADGTLERSAGVPIKAKIFNAGPAGITALLAGEIDVLYVGPSPAVTGYIRSQGQALRVVAGAASGGAVLALRPGVDPENLAGLRLATPGMANTQDVALRHYLAERGLKPKERGGNVTIVPMPNAEILGLMARGQVDGAWVPEPWGARLVKEAGAVIAIDERELWPDRRFPTTLVVASTRYLQQNPAAVKGLLAGHVALTRYLQEHPDEARSRLRAGLAALQGKPIPDDVLQEALRRLDFVYDPMTVQVEEMALQAFHLGYLGVRKPDLSGMFDLKPLKEVAP